MSFTKFAQEKDAASFREAFLEKIQSAVADEIEQQKIAVAQSMFGSEDQLQEEMSDEELDEYLDSLSEEELEALAEEVEQMNEAKKPKFQVGDRVRVNLPGTPAHGHEGKVSDVWKTGQVSVRLGKPGKYVSGKWKFAPKHKGADNFGNSTTVHHSNLEHLPEEAEQIDEINYNRSSTRFGRLARKIVPGLGRLQAAKRSMSDRQMAKDFEGARPGSVDARRANRAADKYKKIATQE